MKFFKVYINGRPEFTCWGTDVKDVRGFLASRGRKDMSSIRVLELV